MPWVKITITTLLLAGLAGVWFYRSGITLGAQPALTAFQGGTGTSSPSGILYGDETIRVKTVNVGSNLTFSGGTLSANNQVTGGTAGMLTAWTSATALTATGTPTFAAFVSTSTATSTMAGGLSLTRFNISATSTGSKGIDLSGGCFAVNGTCIGGGAGSQTPWTSDIDAAGYDLSNVATTTGDAFVAKSATSFVPTYTWSGDLTTGLYRGQAGAVGIKASNVQAFEVFSTLILPRLPLLHNQAGSISAPSFSWNADTNTGMYRVGDDIIGFTTGGGAVLRLGTASSSLVVGNFGVGTTGPATKLHVSSGASATTTISLAELGLATSKSCVNMNRSNGSAASFYINAAGTMVVETNYCR